MATENLVYNVIEAAAVARSSRTAIYAAMARGELIARKRGARTVILAADLRRWLDDLPPYRPAVKATQAR